MKAPIAITDDHYAVREGIARLLGRFNYKTIIMAKNGLDLIDRLNSAEVLPEICLMDVRMPHLNGIETTKQVTKLWPSIGVVGFSTYDDEATRQAMLDAGAKAYLVKGTSIEELCDCIDAVANLKKETENASVQTPVTSP